MFRGIIRLVYKILEIVTNVNYGWNHCGEELNSMRKNKKNVWELVILPYKRMPIGSK